MSYLFIYISNIRCNSCSPLLGTILVYIKKKKIYLRQKLSTHWILKRGTGVLLILVVCMVQLSNVLSTPPYRCWLMKSSNPSNWPTPAVKEASPTFQGIKADPVWSFFRFSCIIGNPSRLLTWWHGAKSDICTVGDGRIWFPGAIILEWCIYLLTTLNRFIRCLPSSCADVVYCVLICHVQWHASKHS